MIASVENVLVVDDDVLMREFVVETLTRNGIRVTEASDGIQAKKLLDERAFDMAFLDLKMPGMDGMDVLRHMKESGIEALPVIITAFGTVEKAVDAMKIGAYDFIMKPFSPEQVEIILKKAQELVTLQARNEYLQEELGWKLPRGRQIVGKSETFQALMAGVAKVAKSASSVLVSGETGTGKELVALAIHAASDRRAQPFVRMNCAAVPDSLMDSELFGHEKGSFTSAVATRVGRFELAHKGTLLLDEISEMNQGVQAKLLRVLQEREFERVGGNRTIRVDCRVIATSNRDLKKEVESGKFRQDLFYRLNVVPIYVPPLRERKDDIPCLVESFLERYGRGPGSRNNRSLSFSEQAMSVLSAYSWPGNVRELENTVERICVMEEGPAVEVDMLPSEIRAGKGASPATEAGEPGRIDAAVLSIPEMERLTIMKALKASGNNKSKSAELLNISIRTLRNKLNEYRQKGLMPEEVTN